MTNEYDIIYNAIQIGEPDSTLDPLLKDNFLDQLDHREIADIMSVAIEKNNVYTLSKIFKKKYLDRLYDENIIDIVRILIRNNNYNITHMIMQDDFLDRLYAESLLLLISSKNNVIRDIIEQYLDRSNYQINRLISSPDGISTLIEEKYLGNFLNKFDIYEMSLLFVYAIENNNDYLLKKLALVTNIIEISKTIADHIYIYKFNGDSINILLEFTKTYKDLFPENNYKYIIQQMTHRQKIENIYNLIRCDENNLIDCNSIKNNLIMFYQSAPKKVRQLLDVATNSWLKVDPQHSEKKILVMPSERYKSSAAYSNKFEIIRINSWKTIEGNSFHNSFLAFDNNFWATLTHEMTHRAVHKIWNNKFIPYSNIEQEYAYVQAVKYPDCDAVINNHHLACNVIRGYKKDQYGNNGYTPHYGQSLTYDAEYIAYYYQSLAYDQYPARDGIFSGMDKFHDEHLIPMARKAGLIEEEEHYSTSEVATNMAGLSDNIALGATLLQAGKNIAGAAYNIYKSFTSKILSKEEWEKHYLEINESIINIYNDTNTMLNDVQELIKYNRYDTSLIERKNQLLDIWSNIISANNDLKQISKTTERYSKIPEHEVLKLKESLSNYLEIIQNYKNNNICAITESPRIICNEPTTIENIPKNNIFLNIKQQNNSLMNKDIQPNNRLT